MARDSYPLPEALQEHVHLILGMSLKHITFLERQEKRLTTARMRDRDYAAYYERKYHEVRAHQHEPAIVLTARKLVRLVVRLLTTNQPYQARRS